MEITRNPYDKTKPLSKVEQYKQKLSQRNENQTWILSNFFGKQGGGAPIKDSSGKTVTKMISVADENIYRLESSEFSKASTQPLTSLNSSSPMQSQQISNTNTSLPNYITNMSISMSNPNLNLKTLPYVPQPNSTTQYITASNTSIKNEYPIHNPEMYLQHFKQNELAYPPVAPLPYAYPPSYLIPYLYPPPYAVPNYPPYLPHKAPTTQGVQKPSSITNRGDGRERPSSNKTSGITGTQYNKDNDDGYCLPEERDDKESKSDKEAQMLKWQKELDEQIAEKKAREELERKRLEEEERLEEIKNQEYFEYKNKQREKQEQLRQSKIKQNQLNESNDGSNINNINILSNNQFETQIQTTNNNEMQQQLPNQQTELVSNNNTNININTMKQHQQQQPFISEYDQKEEFKNSIELGLRNINETLTKEYENELHRINTEYSAKLGTITKELMQATNHPDSVYHDVKIQHNKRLNHVQNIIEQRNLISLIFDKPHLETKPTLYYNSNKDLELQLPSYFGQNVDNATSRYNTLQSQSHFCGFDNAEMSAEYLDEHTKNATVLIEDPTNSDINVKLFGVNDFNYDERRLDNESSFIPLHGKGEAPVTTTVQNEEIKGKYLSRQLEQHDKDYNYFNMLNKEYDEIQQLSKKINPISKAGMINKEFNIDYNTIKEQNVRETLQSNNS